MAHQSKQFRKWSTGNTVRRTYDAGNGIGDIDPNNIESYDRIKRSCCNSFVWIKSLKLEQS